MLEGPDDGVQDQFELGRGDGQEGREALGGGGLEEVEEMGSVFWEFFKVLTVQKENNKVSECLGAGVFLPPAAAVIRRLKPTLLIMFKVHSKTASKILGISPVMWTPSLLTMVAMVLRTSGSRAAGTFLW